VVERLWKSEFLNEVFWIFFSQKKDRYRYYRISLPGTGTIFYFNVFFQASAQFYLKSTLLVVKSLFQGYPFTDNFSSLCTVESGTAIFGVKRFIMAINTETAQTEVD